MDYRRPSAKGLHVTMHPTKLDLVRKNRIVNSSQWSCARSRLLKRRKCCLSHFLSHRCSGPSFCMSTQVESFCTSIQAALLCISNQMEALYASIHLSLLCTALVAAWFGTNISRLRFAQPRSLSRMARTFLSRLACHTYAVPLHTWTS